MSESQEGKYMLALHQAIQDDVDDQVLRNSEFLLQGKPGDQDVLLCKITALAKIGKYQQANQLFNNLKTSTDSSKFLKAYLGYRLGSYQEALSLAESAMGDPKMEILKSQVYCKRENYEASCNILAGLLNADKSENESIYEDLCANFFNSLALYVWANISNKKMTTLSAGIQKGLETALQFCLTKSQDITLREVYLNLCILLSIDTTFGTGLFSPDQMKTYSEQFLKEFEKVLKADTEGIMQEETESDVLGEHEKDQLIAKVIEVIFHRKNNKIRIIEGELEKLEKDYFRLGDEDVFLKTSVLSYLLFLKMHSTTNSGCEMHVLTKELDAILLNLKKSKLGKKMQEIVQANVQFNKAITLLLRGKFMDLKELNLSSDIWDNLSIKAYVNTKNKKVEAVNQLSDEVNLGQTKDKFLINLLQIGSFHLLNNQALYVDKFVDFMNKSVLPEYKNPSSSFHSVAFKEFFNGMVKHIFKNSALLTRMKDSVHELVASFEDVEVLHNIAESFASKKDYTSSENIYRRILEIDPSDAKALRKTQHFLALREPSRVNYDELPPISLITENERLRAIEVDYLQFKGPSKASSGPVHQETTRVIKKEKKPRKHKIRWPKGFDPRKPGPLPDPERWVHKLERTKGKKKGGYKTDTQGSSNVNTSSTRGNFQQGPSTANLATTKAPTKKGKKK